MQRVVLFLLLTTAAPAWAQTESPEIRLLRAVHHTEQPVLVAWFGATDATAYPVFYAGVPAMWAATLPGWVESREALRWTAGIGGSALVAGLLKRTVQRPRPYRTLPDITPRRKADQLDRLDPFSFPSGHATLAFAYATSAVLTWPEWYVILPATLWASGVTLSRLWVGVHYPGDLLVGMVIGTGAAVLAHLLLPDPESPAPLPATLGVSVRF